MTATRYMILYGNGTPVRQQKFETLEQVELLSLRDGKHRLRRLIAERVVRYGPTTIVRLDGDVRVPEYWVPLVDAALVPR